MSHLSRSRAVALITLLFAALMTSSCAMQDVSYMWGWLNGEEGCTPVTWVESTERELLQLTPPSATEVEISSIELDCPVNSSPAITFTDPAGEAAVEQAVKARALSLGWHQDLPGCLNKTIDSHETYVYFENGRKWFGLTGSLSAEDCMAFPP